MTPNGIDIVKADHTVAHYPNSTVDFFETSTITVTSLDNDAVLDIFPPGTWRYAHAYGSDGYPTFSFTAQEIA